MAAPLGRLATWIMIVPGWFRIASPFSPSRHRFVDRCLQRLALADQAADAKKKQTICIRHFCISQGWQLARLLRARRERPHRRAAAERDEIAPPYHSITSSARASSVGGMVRPLPPET